MNQKIPEYFGKQRITNPNFENSSTDIILWEVIKVNPNQRMIFRFINTNSPYRQGVHLGFYYNDGEVIINGVSASHYELWEDECPQVFNIECRSKEGYLSLYNVFEMKDYTGNLRKISQIDSCGMILEKNDNIYRYKCNDVGFETSFDKLIFELELL